MNIIHSLKLSYYFVIISIAMTFSSCTTSTTNNFSYVINNISDKELNVYVKTHKIDSTFKIIPHTQSTIYNGYEVFEGDAPSFGNPFFLKVFDILRIETVDYSTIALDYLNQSNWKSYQSGISTGSTKTTTTTYKINITNSNFN